MTDDSSADLLTAAGRLSMSLSSLTHSVAMRGRGDGGGGLPASFAMLEGEACERLGGSVSESIILASRAWGQNVAVGKLVGAIGHVCTVAEQLREEAREKAYPVLLLMGEAPLDEDPFADGVAQERLSSGIGALSAAASMADTAAEVAVNALSQLTAITGTSHLYASVHKVEFLALLRATGSALSVLAIMDSVIAQNPGVATSLALFRRMLETVEDSMEDYGVTEEKLEELQTVVDRIESRFVPEEPLLLRVLQDRLASGRYFRATAPLVNRLGSGIKTLLRNLQKRMAGGATEVVTNRDEMLNITLLTILYYWVAGGAESPDQKLAKMVWDCFKVAPVVCGFCKVPILLPELLQSSMPPWAVQLLPKDHEKAGQMMLSDCLSALDSSFDEVTRKMAIATNKWVLRMVALRDPQVIKEDRTSMVLSILNQGINIAYRLRHCMIDFNMLHVHLSRPLSTSDVLALGRGLEVLKAIEEQYGKLAVTLAGGVLQQVLHFLMTKLHDIVEPRKGQLEARLSGASPAKVKGDKGTSGGLSAADDAALDAFAAATIIMSLLHGPPSVSRLSLIDCIGDILRDTRFFSETEAEDFADVLHRLKTVTNLHKLVIANCDTSFTYFSRDSVLPALLSGIYGNSINASKLIYVVAAFRSGETLLSHGPGGCDYLLSAYREEIDNALNECILEPLCRDVETDLRLHLHSAKLEGTVISNPTKTGIRDIGALLSLPPLRLHGRLLDIRWHVVDYLNETFYNLTTVALHNWRTYGEMAELARQKYGIVLDKIPLPAQQLEQGLDVLEVMRNIHIFVANFTYNLNMQVFIERGSAKQKKHLNTISIRHIANSIRTHGMGIIDTTVKFTYQYLAQKFIVFSQFLYDDHIKSRLRRELKMFGKIKIEKGTLAEYPYDAAEKFKKDIRKSLGTVEDGGSYLDQFRKLITEVGNALGFVRMVRMGASNFSHGAVRFISVGGKLESDPNVEQEYMRNDADSLLNVDQASHSLIGFEESCEEEGLSADTIDCAKLLDDVRRRMQMSINSSNYFKILVDVFRKGLNIEKNVHLNDFYIIVPALCSSHVDSLLLSKDKLTRRGKDSAHAAFTDDGFALGIGYILKVLGQDEQLDALHWFDAVRGSFLQEIQRLNDNPKLGSPGVASSTAGPRRSGGQLSEEEIQNLQLLRTRAKAHAREFELLEYTVSASRTFFAS